MCERRVTSLGPLAPREPAGAPWRAVVRAVSASSCVLDPGDAPLVVVHATAHGHTPTSVLVDDAAPRDWGVRPGDRVTWRPGRLHLGAAPVLHTTGAARWSPPDPPAVLRAVPFDAAVLDAGALARIGGSCARLAAALVAHDAVATAREVRALVGNGPGSTPSGDDALAGLLTVLERAGRERPRARLAAAVSSNLERTTLLGAHYLRLACDGHAGEHLLAVVDAALGGVLVPADERIATVRDTGATSGADALVGVAAGLAVVTTPGTGRCAA